MARDSALFSHVRPRDPLYSAEEIYGIFSSDPAKQYDTHEIIGRIVDAGEFDEYRAEYGETLLCGYARVGGWAVGLVANQKKHVQTQARGSDQKRMEFGGVIYTESAEKAARFIMDCNQNRIPLVFLHDVNGFMVGKDAEWSGIIRAGAKMVNAVANSVVPKIAVICGGSFGAGHYAMCGKAYEPGIIRFPAHRVMSGAEAATANHGNLGDHAVGHGIDHFRARADDAAPLGVLADHKAVHIVQKHKWDTVLVTVHNEASGFLGRFGINYSAKFHAFLVRSARLRLHVLLLVGDKTNCPPANSRIAAEQRFAVFGSILVEFTGVHDAPDDFVRIILFRRIAGKNAVDFLGGIKRVARPHMAEWRGIRRSQLIRERANAIKTRLVIRLTKIHGPADLRMHFRAAQIFGGRLLPDGGLHQRGTGEKQSRPFGHEDVIAHHRKIRASRHAHAHDGGNLRNAHSAHDRIVAKDAAKIVGIRKNIFLQGKKQAP